MYSMYLVLQLPFLIWNTRGWSRAQNEQRRVPESTHRCCQTCALSSAHHFHSYCFPDVDFAFLNQIHVPCEFLVNNSVICKTIQIQHQSKCDTNFFCVWRKETWRKSTIETVLSEGGFPVMHHIRCSSFIMTTTAFKVLIGCCSSTQRKRSCRQAAAQFIISELWHAKGAVCYRRWQSKEQRKIEHSGRTVSIQSYLGKLHSGSDFFWLKCWWPRWLAVCVSLWLSSCVLLESKPWTCWGLLKHQRVSISVCENMKKEN